MAYYDLLPFESKSGTVKPFKHQTEKWSRTEKYVKGCQDPVSWTGSEFVRRNRQKSRQWSVRITAS